MQKNVKQHSIVRTILQWYKRQGRTLPWRNITNAYRILVSEIMLQQTQVSRVLLKYPEFLHRFPALRSLANAEQRDVVLAWQGMGYNNRAVRLHKFARVVVEKHRGRIPQDYDSLIALPGIGKYTAYALLSSAFGKQLPVVDVNVQRVISRIFWRMKSTSEMRNVKGIWKLAEAILFLHVIARRSLPKQSRLAVAERLLRSARNDKSTGKAYDWNQALMDLGATVCTARTPKCEVCPVAGLCSSRATMKRYNVVRSKREPSLDGIPNRFYRGRIIERLRKLNGTGSVSLNVLGREIYPKFEKKNEAWLRSLISDLERDGLIRVKGNGTLQTSRVLLA